MSAAPKTDDLRPMTELQVLQTREFVESLQESARPTGTWSRSATSLRAS